MCAGPDGQKTLEADQLATFAFYVKNIQCRFVVTQLGKFAEVSVTHRDSGKRVCTIPYMSTIAALGDYVVAGKGEIQRLIDRVGAEKVLAVLRAG